MQSVPLEFIAHTRPLMFVAGLGGESSAAATTAPAVQAEGADSATETPSQAFTTLVQSLRQTLVSKRPPHGLIYDPLAQRGAQDFHVVLVDKGIRFPPRKARHPTNPSQPGPHSPISPYTPTSPLYPDGIIAPIWVRKHRELIPSVFVLVLQLYEYGRDPVNAEEEKEAGPLGAEELVAQRDEALVQEILARKRGCSALGVKLAVILLTSRELLDSPALDTRLSNVRRSSTLDSRASLFVLSPVERSEVQLFVKSLKGELIDSARDYYREHGRRLRRKRSRPATSIPLPLPNSNATGSASTSAPDSTSTDNPSASTSLARSRSGTGSAPPAQPLTTQALNVRYDYKAGVFAEFRGETEVSLKHYEDCYSGLLDLLVPPPVPSTSATQPSGGLAAFIAPRTKRWAEARVLLDTLSFKISKGYLYLNNPQYALAQLRLHVLRVQRISRAYWGMKEQGWEECAWRGKQYRLFADLLALALKSGFILPPLPSASPMSGGPLQTRAASQHVPAYVPQHPGVYYFMAASCAKQRWEAFQLVLEEHQNKHADEQAIEKEAQRELPPALKYEKSTPHAEQVIELLGLAYEFYKTAPPPTPAAIAKNATAAPIPTAYVPRARFTTYLATLILHIHRQTRNATEVARFEDRTVKAYRKDKGWNRLLVDCMGEEGELGGKSAENSVEHALRRMAIVSESTATMPDKPRLLRDLVTATATESGDSEEGQRILLSSEQHVLPITIHSTFYLPSADLSQCVPVQVHILLPAFGASDPSLASAQSSPSTRAWSEIRTQFTDDREPLVVRHSKTSDNPEQRSNIRRINLGKEKEGSADLSWEATESILIQGVLTSRQVNDVAVKCVTLVYEQDGKTLELRVTPTTRPDGRARWVVPPKEDANAVELLEMPRDADFSMCRFQPRQLRCTFSAVTDGPAYLNESFPVTITVSNNDTLPVSVSCDALLHPFAPPSSGKDAAPVPESADSLSMVASSSAPPEERNDIVGGGAKVLSNVILVESLGPGESIERKVEVSCLGMPGKRILDLSVVCRAVPLSEAVERAEASDGQKAEEEDVVAVTELSHPPLSIDAVHPFYCDFRTTWLRPSSEKRNKGKGKTDTQDEQGSTPLWPGSRRLLLDVNMGAMGPTSVKVKDIRLLLENLPGQCRCIRSSLTPNDGQLDEAWEPEDPFAITYELELSPAYDGSSAGVGVAVLGLEWARSANDPRTTRTLVPIPPFVRPTQAQEATDAEVDAFLQPVVLASVPSRATLYEPFELSFYYSPPYAQDANTGKGAVSLSYIVESASENFVFSGPRRVERQILNTTPSKSGVDPAVSKPSQEMQLITSYQLVPIGNTGPVELPRFRAWQALETQQEALDRWRDEGEHEREQAPRMRELRVEVEGSAVLDTRPGPLEVFVVPP